MAYDILIKNGVVIDGSGMPGARADVAIAGDRIAEVGKVTGQAKRVIDAQGRMVAPGFIDIHTHYDPHWWWNPLGTSSAWHGVTSVVMGNCGLSLAPCKPEHRAQLTGIFGTVEELSKATMDAVVPWNWESYPEYLNQLEGHLGLNVAGMVGHSAIRLYAMGEASLERAATPEEIARMQQLLRQSMEGGAFGWSTSLSPTHVGAQGEPVPSRQADNAEVFALADVMGEYNCGGMEIIPPNSIFGVKENGREIMRQMGLRGGRPVNWLGHSWKWFLPDLWREEQRWMREVAKEGAMLFGNISMQPFDREINFKRSMFFAGFKIWRDIMKLPMEERKAKLADKSMRQAMREAMDHPDESGETGAVRPRVRWEGVTVRRVALPQNKWMEGKTVPGLAQQKGVHVGDFMADLAVEENLETIFHQRFQLQSDSRVVGEMLQSPHVTLGSSDSGAHINSMVQSGEAIYCLKRWVSEVGALGLEDAIRRLTFVPALLWGITDRGLLRPGMKADINVFSFDDLDTGKKEVVQDVPSGETRWIQKAQGIGYTLVNGQVLMENGSHSGVLPGEVLRSAAYKGR